eukprot:scaffold284026_cov38-Tisochrysis_lutea.AAC.2
MYSSPHEQSSGSIPQRSRILPNRTYDGRSRSASTRVSTSAAATDLVSYAALPMSSHIANGDNTWRVEQLYLGIDPHPAESPRHSRTVLGFRFSPSNQAINKRRFAHVGISKYGCTHWARIDTSPLAPFVHVPTSRSLRNAIRCLLTEPTVRAFAPPPRLQSCGSRWE